jgi:hypothetical protein
VRRTSCWPVAIAVLAECRLLPVASRSGFAVVLAVLLAGLVVLPVGGASFGRSSNAHETFSVTYTPGTIVVPPAIVTQNLVSVSADGNTFTFKGAVGPLASLAVGKVMLLQGKAVGVVTAVNKSSGHLIVTTRQPAITDVIQSGTVDVNAPITFAGAMLTPEPEAPPNVTFATTRLTASNLGASHAAVGSSAARLTDTFSGAAGPIAYKATLSRSTDRLDFDITYNYNKNDLEGTVHVDGYLDTFDAHLQMLVKSGQVSSSNFLARPLDGHMHVTWTLGRGDTSKYTIKVPVFTLPLSLNFPFIVGGFPFFVKLNFQTLMTIAISAKSGIIEGGAELDYKGSGGGLSTGGALSTEGAEQMAGQFLSTAGSLTLASSGAVLAFNAPKITVGIGLPTLLNGTAYLDVISSLGQTTGSAVAGQSCSKYDVDFTVKAGLGAELIKSLSLPSKVLYTKSATRTVGGPGC